MPSASHTNSKTQTLTVYFVTQHSTTTPHNKEQEKKKNSDKFDNKGWWPTRPDVK
jgi:hypothetical protein